MTTINGDSRLTVPEDVVFRDVVGEAMILHLGSGVYFGLDAVATRVWELIVAGRRLQDVCEALVAEFDAPAERIQADVTALVEQLVAKRLLDVN
jgi:hypothetical protein